MMIYSREQQWQILEDELKAEVHEFDTKLKTSAISLMEKGEIFTAQFLSFSASGEMRVRFSLKRPIPRKGEYLYCMTLHKELRNHKNWGSRTYGDLVKDKTNQTEAICNWISHSNDPRFMIAGFIGIDKDFADWIVDAPGVVLILGPNRPPYEYIANLQTLTLNRTSKALSSVLDVTYTKKDWTPVLLNKQKSISEFLYAQLEMYPALILQGPPGTGKTHNVSQLVADLCNLGFSVLVTALTNRALMEIAEKKPLSKLLSLEKVYKTKITIDEEKEMPLLQLEKNITPKKGCITLSTFYITSGFATNLPTECPFDYVIMDEASQALLPMIAAVRLLGKHCIFVGDIKQLPPITMIKASKIKEHNYREFIDGLKTITGSSLFPIFQLTDSFRLTDRGAKYTSIFYHNNLCSKAKKQSFDTFGAFFLHCQGGPTLLMTDMELGNLRDNAMLNLALSVITLIHSKDTKCSIAVLTCMKETVRALQGIINSKISSSKILIDTVARVQGLTTDICIYVIPNTHYLRTLEPSLFNVATSRAKRQTIIIADKEILGYTQMNIEVRNYLQSLYSDFSFYLPYNKEQSKMIE